MENREEIIRQAMHEAVDILVNDHFIRKSNKVDGTVQTVRNKMIALLEKLSDEDLVTATSLVGRFERIADTIFETRTEREPNLNN